MRVGLMIGFTNINNNLANVIPFIDLAKSKSSVALKIVSSVASNVFKVYSLYSMYDSALSDILCLKTFRHGTNPYAAARITLTGPDLNRSGQEGEAAYYQVTTGSESVFAARDQSRKAFYVAEDLSGREAHSNIVVNTVANYVLPILTAKYYALRSTATFGISLLPLPSSWKGKITKGAVNAIESDRQLSCLGVLCPTVKFHINPNRLDPNCSSEPNFISMHQDTYDAGIGALYTQDQFSTLDCGILGSLRNGINKDLFARIKENKGQFMWGVAQLVTAVAFTAFFFPSVVPGSFIVTSVTTPILALKRYGEIGNWPAVLMFGGPMAYAGLQF
jgi:hypothetical protein